MHALVLAGAKDLEGGESYRAGLIVGGRSLLAQTLAALVDLPGLEGTILVGPADLVPAENTPAITRVLSPSGGLVENVARGLEVLPSDEPVLVVASDLPLLTQAALRDFLANCAQREAEIYYPIIRREVYEAAYPGSRRTYLGVRDGTFTGGNVVLLKPASVFQRHKALITKAIDWRKQPQRLGRLLGLGFFLGLLRRAYTVAQIETRVTACFGLGAAAVESRFSEIGYDVDAREDLAWIEFYWGGTLEGARRQETEEDAEK